MSKISQREAERLKKRAETLAAELNRQRDRWASEWPGGTHIGSTKRERDWLAGRLESARVLQHAIVCVPSDDGTVAFYALPLPKA